MLIILAFRIFTFSLKIQEAYRVNTETINTKTQQSIVRYKEAFDPLLMMGLIFELGRTQRENLTDEQWRQISGCHELLAAIFRNE